MIEETCYGSSLRSVGFRLSTTLLLIFLIFTVQTGQAEDFDQDGINDANDLCLSTDLNGPVPTGILCDGCMGDDQTILGCNASDVLACKPGPNNRQFEMGINQRIQDMFSAQKGWAAKCGCDDNSDPDGDGFLSCVDQCPLDGGKSLAGLCGCGIPDTDSDGDGTPDCVDLCPNNPGATVPDEYGNCASDSDVITAGEALVLALDGAALSIPADALESGMTVTLAEIDPDLLGTQPNGPGEMQITPVYSLAFSAAQPATGDLTFVFDIPPSVTTGFYARIKIEGGLGTEGQSESDWVIVFGEYDAQQSQLTIKLGATATRFLIAGISTDAAAPSVPTEGSLSNEVNDLESIMTQSLAASAIKPSPSPEWGAYGWAVFCDPNAFSNFNLTSCDQSSPDFHTMMNDLGAKLYASDQTLTSLGFLSGGVRVINALGRIRTNVPHVIYDPDNRSATTASIGGNELLHYIVWVTPNTTDSTLGYYEPSTEQIYVDKFETDDTIIHELMHAVQILEIVNAWDQNWVVEALASAIEIYATSISVLNGEDYRYFGDWRDWGYPLANEAELNEYQALEFWLSVDGTLSLLQYLHDNLGVKTELTDVNAHTLVDEALTETGLPSLRDGYSNLILSRNYDVDYPYCESVSPNCTGNSCEIVTPISPISASCFDASVFFDSCGDGEEDIVVSLVSDSGSTPNPNLEIIVDGGIYAADTEVPFTGQGRIWAINTDYSAANASQTATIKFENKANCSAVTLIAQQYSIAATTGISTKNITPIERTYNRDSKVINSLEDQILANAYGYPFNIENWADSTESVIKIHQYFLQNTDGDDTVEDTREDTTTVIAPLGAGSQNLAESVSSDISDGSAKASASGTSNMVLNGENGVPIMFDWDFTVSRSLLFVDPSNIDAGQASAGVLGFLYLNVAPQNRATLEMGWDCSFFSVSVLRQIPTLYSIENWNNGESGCGVVRQFTLTEGSYRINFQGNAGLINIVGDEGSSGHLSLSVKELQ